MTDSNAANGNEQNSGAEKQRRHKITMRIAFAHFLIALAFFAAIFLWGSFE